MLRLEKKWPSIFLETKKLKTIIPIIHRNLHTKIFILRTSLKDRVLSYTYKN